LTVVFSALAERERYVAYRIRIQPQIFSSPESVVLTHTTYSFGEREVLTSLEGELNSTMLHFKPLSICSWGMFGSVGWQSFIDVSGR